MKVVRIVLDLFAKVMNFSLLHRGVKNASNTNSQHVTNLDVNIPNVDQEDTLHRMECVNNVAHSLYQPMISLNVLHPHVQIQHDSVWIQKDDVKLWIIL